MQKRAASCFVLCVLVLLQYALTENKHFHVFRNVSGTIRLCDTNSQAFTRSRINQAYAGTTKHHI